MIKISDTETYGWQAAIRGMRNPMNSWKKSDSYLCPLNGKPMYAVGSNDLELMKRLARSGTDHGKFMRMITVTCDLTAPLYWWKEYDTYKVGTVANSCSTMHKIQEKEFALDDFSHEHLNYVALGTLKRVIWNLNVARSQYAATHFEGEWWQMIQLLPTSYNQKRTVQLN